jgi:hypothetical protein
VPGDGCFGGGEPLAHRGSLPTGIGGRRCI